MFSKIVNLYRLAGRPPIHESEFSYSGVANENLKTCIQEVERLSIKYGHFEEEPKEKGGKTEFSFRIAANGTTGFFSDFVELVQLSRALGKGQKPEDFYIIKEDWATSDSESHPKNQKLATALEIIDCLSTLATTKDNSSSNTNYTLFFSAPGEKEKSLRSFSISTSITEDIFNYEIRHAKLLKLLTSETAEHKINMEERKLIFCAAIIESVPHNIKRHLSIMDIFKHWDTILEKYWLNLQVFVHGFSFAKIREDLAKAELEYGAKLSTTFSDIAGKLLALPVSLIGLVALEKSTTAIEAGSAIVGLLIVSIVAAATLYNQELNIERIKSGINIVFDQFDKNSLIHRREVRELFKKSKQDLAKQQKFLTRTLLTLKIICSIPIAGALWVSYYKWKEQIDPVFAIIIGALSHNKP